MVNRHVLLLLLLYCVSCPAAAQSVVLTWEDDAKIQLLENPDGSFPVTPPPAELISGGLAARFLTDITAFGGPASVWLATDFRVQSKSLTLTWNPQACAGHIATVNSLSGVLTELSIAAHFPVNAELFTDTGNTNAPECTGFDTAMVTFQGARYTGFIQYDGSFTGTVDAPDHVSNATALIFFGQLNAFGLPTGIASIQGTLRVEISDYNATVVKLRQGIEPLPQSFAGSWSDGNPPWEANPEPADGSVISPITGQIEEIYNVGCRLTSLSMALNSEGVHFVPKSYCGLPLTDPSKCPAPELVSNDPGSLNTFASKPSMQAGYLPNGVVDPVDVLYALSGPAALNKHLAYKPGNYECPDPVSSSCVAAENFLTGALQQGHPVIVGVEDCKENGEPHFPCHYVLVWGKRNGQWLIADPWPTIPSATTCPNGGAGPGCTIPRLSLSDWIDPKTGKPHYKTEAYVTDPPNSAGLDVTTASDVELLLTGPTGERTGFDAATGAIVQDSGAYFVDSILDDGETGFSTGPARFVFVPQPADGQYTLAVTGFKLGSYLVNVHAYSQDGSIQPVVTVTGIAGPGSGSNFDIGLGTAPGATSTVVRSATTGSALADIQNSLKLGLIAKAGIAASLSDKIHEAATYAASGDCADAIATLKALQNEVRAQTGKAINALAAQVLFQDAAYLIAHCGQ